MTTEQTRLWVEPRHHRRGANLRALGATLTAMESGGQLEPVDGAVVTLCRTAAGLLDAGLADPDESRFVLARLLSEYRESVTLLRSLAPSGSDALDLLLHELQSPPRNVPPAG